MPTNKSLPRKKAYSVQKLNIAKYTSAFSKDNYNMHTDERASERLSGIINDECFSDERQNNTLDLHCCSGGKEHVRW